MTSQWKQQFWVAVGLGSGAAVVLAAKYLRYRQSQGKNIGSADLVSHVILGKPKWIRTGKAGGCGFWYKVRTSPGKHRFVLVETAVKSGESASTVRQLFDHDALAKAIAEKLQGDNQKSTFNADSLSLEDLKVGFVKGGKDSNDFKIADGDESEEEASEGIDRGSLWATFKCANHTWRYGPLVDGQPTLHELGGSQEKTLQPLSVKNLKSRDGGSEPFRLTFENSTGATVLQVHWIDFDGAVKPFKQLKPGEKFAQETYLGHLWLISRVIAREEKENDDDGDDTTTPSVHTSSTNVEWNSVAGYITGDHLHQETLTIAQAKVKCKELPGCTGFYYQGSSDVSLDDPVHITFGSSTVVQEGWQTFTSCLMLEANSVTWTMVDGCIPAGNDLFADTMTVDEAKIRCDKLPECKGFCFVGPPTSEAVKIYFKSVASVSKPDLSDKSKWTSYVKGRRNESSEEKQDEEVDSSDESASSNDGSSESDSEIDEDDSSKIKAWISRRQKEGWLGTYEAEAESTLVITQQSLSLASEPLDGLSKSDHADVPLEGSRAESKLHSEHSLARIRPLYKGGHWICDDCREDFSGPSWHCAACGFDLCIDCLLKTGKLRPDLPLFPVHSLPKSRKVGVAWSPDGKSAAWVLAYNIHMLNFSASSLSLTASTEENQRESSIIKDEISGDTICLTGDGTKDNKYSRHSLTWAKNGKSLAVWKVQSPAARRLQFIESSPPRKVHCRLRNKGKYLRPGDRLPKSQLVIFSSTEHQSEIRWHRTEVAGSLFPKPFTENGNLCLRYHPDCKEVYVEYVARDRQLFRVVACDCLTGSERTIFEEVSEDPSKSFVDTTCGKRDWRWLRKGAEVLFLSERDGWCHLYLIDTSPDDGIEPKQITSGAWVVRKILYIDSEDDNRAVEGESGRGVWFLANACVPGQDPYYQHLCWAPLDGERELRVLTADGDGHHEVMFSPCRKYFLDQWSRVDFPPVCLLRDSFRGSIITELERADASQLLESGYLPPTRFSAKGRDGSTDIHGIIYKPPCLASSSWWWKKVPIVEEIYSGPHGAFCPKSWDGAFEKRHARELVANGFCVVMLDGMGTNYRGRKFLEVSWQALHDQGFLDRKLWIRAAASAFPWMDLSRVGIFGGSAGGQAAMRALLDHGDLYKVAVADCGCHDNRLDKIWWNEQWMGPDISHDCYKRSSNADQAEKLSPDQKLLLIVGEIDSNVDPASTLRVVGALQRAGLQNFELCVVVGQGHGAADTAFGSQRRSDFFLRELKGS